MEFCVEWDQNDYMNGSQKPIFRNTFGEAACLSISLPNKQPSFNKKQTRSSHKKKR